MTEKKPKEIVNIIRERTFGDIIGAPFQFIIQEFKLFAGTLLKFAGPFVALVFLTVSLLANDIYSSTVSNTNLSETTTIYGILLLLSLILGMFSVLAVTHSYITLYVERGKGNFTKDDVGVLLKKTIWKIFGAGILTYVMVIIGVLLLYIPGIYLAIALTFVFLIIIYEKVSIGKAISRSFELIKGNWWKTFGLILVFGMIIGTTSYVFIIPIYVVFILAAVSGTQISIGSAVMVTLFVFLYFTAYMFFMSMQQIMIAFQYFNISVQKEGAHLKDRIAAISENEENPEFEKEIIENNDEEKNEKEKNAEKNRFIKDEDINRFKPKQ